MHKILWAILLVSAIILPLRAELTYESGYIPNQSLQEYFNEAYPNYNKSIIYVFFNSDMSCYNCPQTIDMIEKVYDEYYQNLYSFFIIDYANDQEYNFIETYNLTQPLEVVMVRVNEGATFGYKKIANLPFLESETDDPISFSDDLRYQINSFLQNN